MPVYEYTCQGCGKRFEVRASLEEREKLKVTCPECKSEKVERAFSAFYAKTSRKS
ncbi:MAG: FmdB family zinc ribbon protein [Thermoanaerobaculum sp.]